MENACKISIIRSEGRQNDNIKVYIKEAEWTNVLDSSGSDQGSTVRSCEHNNKP
jgi:hypothetical protein